VGQFNLSTNYQLNELSKEIITEMSRANLAKNIALLIFSSLKHQNKITQTKQINNNIIFDVV